MAIVKGRFYVPRSMEEQGHDLTFRNLSLDGRNPLATLRGLGAALPSPTVDGSQIVFTQDDVSNPGGATCFVIGSVLAAGPDGYGFGRASDIQVTESRIHDCGVHVSPIPGGGTDSGIDLENSRNALIRNDLIYGNADRGILLFPDVANSSIEHNVIDNNARAIEFGGGTVPSSGWASTYVPGEKVYPNDNPVTGNVIAESTLDFPDGEKQYYFQVMGVNAWGLEAPEGEGNVVGENCLFEQTPPGPAGNLQYFAEEPHRINFTDAENNVEPSNGPGFANPAAGDFTLTGDLGTCETTFGPQ